MKKKILIVGLVGLFSFFLTQLSFAAVISKTNGIYTLYLENTNGIYTVKTADSHPHPNQNVLYGGAAGSPWSTYMTIRSVTTASEYYAVDAPTYVSSGYTGRILPTPTVADITGGYKTTYTVTTPDKLTVEQTTVIVGTTYEDSGVRVTTKVTNNDSSSVNIGIRYMWDWMIDGSDDSWFRTRTPDSGYSDVFIGYTPPEFEVYEEINDPNNPIFSIYGTANGPATLSPAPTPPDKLSYVSWSTAYIYSWDFTISGSGLNSAVCYYWGYTTPITLAAGASTTVTQYLTTGEAFLFIGWRPSELEVFPGWNSITLQWIDNSWGETGFQIERRVEG